MATMWRPHFGFRNPNGGGVISACTCGCSYRARVYAHNASSRGANLPPNEFKGKFVGASRSGLPVLFLVGGLALSCVSVCVVV